MYLIDDFSKVDDIGVICRGKSIYALKNGCNQFNHCFIVGQHENAMNQIGEYLIGKKIVQVCNKVVLKVGEEIGSKYGVKDIQLNYSGKQDDDNVGGTKLRLWDECKKHNPWAKVHLLPSGFKSRRSQKRWETTGLMGVDLAAFFRPKNIYIYGLDFYMAEYFCIERKQIENSPARAKKMIENLRNICKRDSHINFHIYTCHHKLEPMNNLRVYKV